MRGAGQYATPSVQTLPATKLMGVVLFDIQKLVLLMLW